MNSKFVTKGEGVTKIRNHLLGNMSVYTKFGGNLVSFILFLTKAIDQHHHHQAPSLNGEEVKEALTAGQSFNQLAGGVDKGTSNYLPTRLCS